jgi:hypothetical protein
MSQYKTDNAIELFTVQTRSNNNNKNKMSGAAQVQQINSRGMKENIKQHDMYSIK